MKTTLQLFAAIVLTLAIAVSSSAGNMHTTAPTPPAEPTPAPASSGETSTSLNGTIHTGNSDEAAAGDAVAADVLSLVRVVLSLL